ncbi:uroporphyrinogen decarboxylase family protein [Verrucomicrobiota bacterium]
MNDLERFKAIAHFEKPDYVPIFGFPGAPGMSGGCMKYTHDRLVETGMPASVGGLFEHWQTTDIAGWRRFWGTTGPIHPNFGIEGGARGFKSTRRVEGDFEIIECENGAITRQVIRNDITYSMPEYVRYPVRDRESWEFFKERMTPHRTMSAEDMETNCRRYDSRDKPLAIGCGGAYSLLRGCLGPEAASLAFYDDPELLHDMIAWQLDKLRNFAFPLIERLKPEAVQMGEDLCYNHGMLLSPEHFREFCGPYYSAVCECARANDVDLVAVDTDGNAMEFTSLAASYGVNAIYPYEVKAGNDLFALRERLPGFVFFGWLEKESVNEGNEAAIETEIVSKVPPLLAKGGYFPNGDHGLQPLVTYPSMLRFMTLLHEVCGNPEGEFPRAGLPVAPRGES